ncbi:hypothetical protein [Fusobacterium pseudoperiodonticum]|uniref:Uncharacterized protein n=1 Tax=Fusobacterium pseudoperiodonticum TaxID=2663009 RepID=A0AAD0F277_9FUSO|nr:hypothetical protein [Fusobacterium pseudoperiodonticum]ATV34672.1 hypothetical protein CTM64_00635 [Fusobacterium pseudoperiodonticum]ATV62435.1 hypothetical protein CTM74_11680 [Fusobacterium pseudoperiodonticum]
MHLFFLLVFLGLLISSIFFTMAEINYIKETLKLKNTKYIILLRVLETMTPFVTLLIASGPRAILKSVFPVFCSLCFLYLIILIIEFFRKKINMKELIVNSVLCIIDVALVTIGLIMIFGF